MPRYFFDIQDGGPHRDDTGTDCANEADMRKAAMSTLPDIAREDLRADGDRRSFTVVARDDQGFALYVATLTYTGLWVNRRDPAAPS